MHWVIAGGTGIAVLLTIGIYIFFFVSAAKLKVMKHSYLPVRLVTHQYGVRRILDTSLEEGDRILVPKGDYSGIWKVRTTDWVKDDEPTIGKKVLDLDTKQCYIFNGKVWSKLIDQLFGRGRGYLVNHKWVDFKWTQEGSALVIQEPMDGAYNIVLSDGSIQPLSIIDGTLYSTFPVSGNRVITKHMASIERV